MRRRRDVHREGTRAARTARRRFLRLLPFPVAALLAAGCSAPNRYPKAAPNTGHRKPPAEQDFQASDFVKSDIDVAAEAHLQESLASARLIMDKLYRRNPREWQRGGFASREAAIARAFDPSYQFRFPELGYARSTKAITLAFSPDYHGDRVFAFGVGLASMILIAYNGKTEFYITDSLDAQRLYNSARNVEIAAWKLANARGPDGQLYLLSNEISDEVRNLSFEREFGKIIAYQDVMARITAQRSNRTIRRVTQTLATAVFLPL